jgi:hypothetical protein
MEPRFGHDFSGVRVHTDAKAAESARAVNALAYAVGRDVVFGESQYTPHTSAGKKLLAHELTHTLQQGQGKQNFGEARHMSMPEDAGEREAARISDMVLHESHSDGFNELAQSIRTDPAPLVVQRDLLAYKTEHTEYLPTAPESTSRTYERYTADAGNIQSALQALITVNKIGLRDAGDHSFFFNRGASRAEIFAAFAAAGYARTSEMTDALLDEHNISVYSRERVTRISSLFPITLERQTQLIERQSERSLSNFEQAEARLVFGNSLNLGQIRLAEDPILSIGSYARTTPWTINFPTGSFGSKDFMLWLIHELTHSWQYQHGVSLFTTIYHSIFSSYDYGGEAGLRAARSAGRGFTSFNTEQQGDILREYYNRFKTCQDITVWQSFVNEVQGVTTPARGAATAPATGTP